MPILAIGTPIRTIGLIFAAIRRVDRWRAHLVAVRRAGSWACSPFVVALRATLWGAAIGAVGGRRRVILLDCGYNNLRAGLNVLFSERRIEIFKLPVKVVRHRLPVRASSSIRVVEEQCLDHVLVLHSKLRAHDVLLYLLAELFKSPAVVELNFKFDLLGAWILRISIGVLV